MLFAIPWAAARAQLTPVAVPAARTSIDANGIDLFLKTFNYQKTDISIGQGAGLLAFTHYLGAVTGRNSLVGSLQATSTSVGGTYSVTLGITTDTFTKTTGITYTNQQGDGATLTFDGSTNTYTYTTTDGTAATFAQSNGMTSMYTNVGYITSLVTTNGARIDYAYRTQRYCKQWNGDVCTGGYAYAFRLQSARNNSGYMLKVGYFTDEIDQPTDLPNWATIANVTAINLAVDYCDPAADSCDSLSQTWPSANYSFPSGGTSTATDPDGRTWTYTINGPGNTIGIRWPMSSSDDITVTFNTNGVQSYATAAGTWTYAFTDNSGANTRTTVVTDPLGHARTLVFDLTSQRMLSDTNALGKTWTYAYDTSGRPAQATAPEGNHSNFTYDDNGNVTDTVTTSKDGSQTIGTHAAFGNCTSLPSACANPTSTTDGNGNVTTYTYTAVGQLATVTQPAPTSGAVQPQTRYGYASYTASFKQSAGAGPTPSAYPISLPTRTSACRTTASCDGGADETRTTVDYSPSLNLVPAYTSSGSGDGALTATTSYMFDLYGNATVVDGPLPGTADQAVSRYDAARQLLGVIGPDPDGSGPLKNRAVRYTRNTNGWVTAVERGTVNSYTDPLSGMTVLAKTAADYDVMGRRVSTSVYDVSTGSPIVMTQVGYDALSRPSCTTVRMNPSTYGSLPDACSLATTGSYGPDRITRTSYDAIGHVVLVQQAYGTGDATNYAQTNAFSDNGQPLDLIDANGNTTAYTYDGFDRAQSTHYPNPTGGGSSATDYAQVLAYDANSNATSYRLRDGNTIAMGYDALNRLTSRSGATVAARTFTYDNLGELLSATLTATGRGTAFGYDALGRVVSEASPVGTFSEGYDLAGRRTSLAWPDGFTVSYTRLVTGEINYAVEATSGTVPVAFYYDDLGRRTGFGKANGHNQGYGYDAASRLTGLGTALPRTTTASFYYNPASQIYARSTSDEQLDANVAYNVTRGYAANGLNQYTKAGAPGLAYDANANLTRLASSTYAYDGDNQLTGGSAGAGLSYDALNRLYQSPDDNGTLWAYAGGMLAGEYTPTGALKRRYLPGDAGDEVLVWYEGTGTTRRYLATDERGSVTEVSDDAGTTLAINHYDDWGIPAAANLGRFGYTGQTWLPSVQAWNYKARIYNPILGRFHQTDPIGYQSDINPYRYVSNDPLNLVDPTGLTVNLDVKPVNPGEIVVTATCGAWCRLDNFTNTLNVHDVFDKLNIVFDSSREGGGASPQRANPPKPIDACGQVAQQSGSITTFGLTGTAIVGGGVTGSIGHFYNSRTGSYGEFFSVGGGGGLDIGGGLFAGHYDSIQNLVGFSVTANGTFGTVSPSVTLSASTPMTNGTVAAGVPGAGASVAATGTRLFNCHVGR